MAAREEKEFTVYATIPAYVHKTVKAPSAAIARHRASQSREGWFYSDSPIDQPMVILDVMEEDYP